MCMCAYYQQYSSFYISDFKIKYNAKERLSIHIHVNYLTQKWKKSEKNPQKLQMSFLLLSFSGLFTERAKTIQNFSGKHKDSKYWKGPEKKTQLDIPHNIAPKSNRNCSHQNRLSQPGRPAEQGSKGIHRVGMYFDFYLRGLGKRTLMHS